ncbi:zona pellucida sperm-binding protein 4-like [Rhincodon typus]|uniref:zona pellucida sperm-binding protein 4-like n=1 Tax=Rhincodon typus TaxID=259920 RepID=UPI0020309DFA|nr:zona pellucida sperm-binding protein 4-like [Rhincodon typus]
MGKLNTFSFSLFTVCTADGQFILAITRNLTRPALNLSSLYVKDGREAECRPKLITEELVAFRFPITSCGSTQREETGSFVYETDILGKRLIQTGPQGSITRDSTFSLHVQCQYKGEHEAGLQINVSVYTLPPPLAASEDGILRLELQIAKDGNYRLWYKDSDYPIERILRESVFVEVRVKDRTDPMLVLRLRDCWATPVPAPDHEVQWSLLVDGPQQPMGKLNTFSFSLFAVCTADGQFILAITRNLTRPALNLSSLYVKDGREAECRPKLITEELAAFRFPITSCGSTQREETGSFVYEMDILGKRMIQTGPQGSITRDSTFSLHVQCKYKGEHEAGLQINVSVYTLPPPPAASEDGILRLELQIAKDGNYRLWYKDSDYPIERILRESVFVEVRVKDRTDPMIVLRLRDCWATPVPAPDHEVQWSLLVDGCPYEGDDYLTVLHPVDASSGLQFPGHHKRFEVKTFVFLDGVSEQPLSGQVYLHCSAEVCSPSAQDDCITRCGPRSRRSAPLHEGTLVSAPGPVVFLLQENSQSKQLLNENGAAGSPVVVGVAIGFLVFLLVVMAAVYRMKNSALSVPSVMRLNCSP